MVRAAQCRDGIVALDARQTKHLVTVLRLRPGDEFVVVAEGEAYVAVLETARGSQATARLVRPVALPPEDPWNVTLAVAIPRHPGLFDQIVDQATQLGVSTMIPMLTHRTIVRLDAVRAAARERRWTQVAIEAAQQSGRTTVPTIVPVTTFTHALAMGQASDCRLLPTLGEGTIPLAEAVRRAVPRHLFLYIGPEGDFTPKEVAQAIGEGAVRISLGHRILRCDTAVVAALILLTQALQDLSKK